MSEVANTEQLAAWDGDEGEHWSTHEERYDATTRVHSELLVDLAAIEPSEQVLDLGCGCGASTRDAARAAGDGAAVGIDLSSQMLDVARRRAVEEGLDNVSFVHGDAQVHTFDARDVRRGREPVRRHVLRRSGRRLRQRRWCDAPGRARWR